MEILIVSTGITAFLIFIDTIMTTRFMIGYRYYKLIQLLIHERQPNGLLRLLNPNKYPLRYALFKLLGGCIFCYGFWITLLLCFISELSLIETVCIIGVSQLLLKLWFRYGG